MSAVWTSVAPIWKVLLVGLVLGAGLPALFAVGIRLNAPSANGGAVSVLNRAGSTVCFAIIAVVVVVGLIILTATKAFLAKFGLS